MSNIEELFERQNQEYEVTELCRKFGAAFVIDAARAWVRRKEAEAAREHQRWRDEMLKAAKEPGNDPA